MSDLPATALSGGVSPSRDIATHRYRVTGELGQPGFPVGSEFRAWAWGETFAQIEGRGPVLTNSQIEEWLSRGKIRRADEGGQ